MIDCLVTGAGGMLALAFLKNAGTRQVAGFTHKALDITNTQAVYQSLKDIAPKVVINCAAYTDVTAAETNPQAADAVNATGPANLARACKALGIKLVHFSSDYVFSDSPVPHTESDEPHPVNRYGLSKLLGEQAIQNIMDDYLIIRIQWVYGPGGRNFAATVKNWLQQRNLLKIVSDQYGSCTYSYDVVDATYNLLDANAKGVFHFTNKGRLSRYQFTLAIQDALQKQFKINCKVEPIPGSEYPDQTPRPHDSVLGTDKYEQFTGKTIPGYADAINRFIKEDAHE